MDPRNATECDRKGVVATLTSAFAGDAIVRFLFPNDESYARLAGLFFGHYFDVRLAGGEVIVFGETVAGAALWNPPGGNRLGREFVEDDWRRNVAAGLGVDALARYRAFTEVLEAMTPGEPHWYLGLLGTDPGRRRTGVASALIAPMLARADREGVPVFLETGMAPNVGFYRRFGFDTVAETDVPGGPRVWGLLRPPA